MNKKIAIPVNLSGVLDSHFGHCSMFSFITVENGNIVGEERIVPPPHQPGVLPVWVAEQKATDVIAGGMGQHAIHLFNENGVNVFVGAPKLGSMELVRGFLDGSLSFNANYCDH